MNTLIKKLQVNESKIDDYINGIKFNISIIDIRNHINWILSLNQIDQIFKNDKRNSDANIDSLTSVYSYLRENLNEDITESLKWDGENHNYNEILTKEVYLLCKYKMLFNILPLVYRANKNIYRLEEDKDKIIIKYLKDDYLKFESFDILFTRISLMVNFNNVMHNKYQLKNICDKFFSKNGFYISYPDQLYFYKKFIQIYKDKYKNSFYLLSDSFLEPIAGFKLEDFRKFVAGVFTINQFSNEMIICAKMSNKDLIDNNEFIELLVNNIYNKKEKYDIFRSFFCSLTNLSHNKFEKIMAYFLVDYDESSLDLSGDEFIVPFFKKDGYIYFNSIFITQVVNPRNLIYSMNNLSNKILKDSKYDSVSKELELNFIEYMRKIFESYDLEFYGSKDWNISGKQGELDAVVVCKNNKKIMIIQTKTVVAASNYRTLFSLQDNMKVAVNQLIEFDERDIELKNDFLSRIIGEDVSDYEVFNCLNSEGGLGNALIWEEIFETGFIPFNVNMIILYFNIYKNLNNFKDNMYQLIESLNNKTSPELIKCEMNFSQECEVSSMIHDSTSANYLNLIEEMKIIHEKLQSI